MPLVTEQFVAMTDAELRAIAETPAWDDTVYCYWDKKGAKNELDLRAVVGIRRGVEVGDTIEFVRHGTTPKGGKSRNHRDGYSEEGVSVYLLSGDEVVYVGWWFGIATKPAYRGRGVVVGFGSDGEPLVQVLGVRRAKEFDRK